MKPHQYEARCGIRYVLPAADPSPLDGLASSDGTVFLDLCRSLRLVCPRCGGRTMHVVPLWPDVRQTRAASLGVDTRLTLRGTMPGYQMPGVGDA